MALSDQQIADALAPSVAALAEDHIRRGQLYDRGHDAQGNPIIDAPAFIELTSPDGTVWRLKVSNAGVLSAVEAPA